MAGLVLLSEFLIPDFHPPPPFATQINHIGVVSDTDEPVRLLSIALSIEVSEVC